MHWTLPSVTPDSMDSAVRFAAFQLALCRDCIDGIIGLVLYYCFFNKYLTYSPYIKEK